MPDTLHAEERLDIGQKLVSSNNEYELVMQQDGNLVLYHRSTGHPQWSTGTTGQSVAAAVMQRDGNFVLYGYSSEVRWASRTTHYPGQGGQAWRVLPGAYLKLEDDGRLSLYAPLKSWPRPLWPPSSEPG